LIVARGKKRQVVESKGIAQANGRLDRKGGIGEDGKARVDNGIAAAEIGESIGVSSGGFVYLRTDREAIAPTDSGREISKRAGFEGELVLNQRIAAELVFEGVGEGGIAVMGESVV